jgi:glycosyltransferase involved in cell wall biosynthesis
MENGSPKISVVICTRNRGDKIIATLQSIVANKHPSFEILVIDQSTNDITEIELSRLGFERNFRYFRTQTKGVGLSRTLGMQKAHGEIVVYTDDDCTVPPNWLSVLEGIFDHHPKVGIVFCNVAPAEHDAQKYIIPHRIYKQNRVIKKVQDFAREIGMGAGMAVRREAGLSVGGFDGRMGPGSEFQSGEDLDLSFRILFNGWWVYETPDVSVIHFGHRTYQQFKELTKRDWIGIGGAFAKPVKCRKGQIFMPLFYVAGYLGLIDPFKPLLRMKRPQGFKRLPYFWQGFSKGLKTSVGCDNLLYQYEDVNDKETKS